MTAQMDDMVHYRVKRYSLIGVKGNGFAKDFIQEHYVRMGFRRVVVFKTPLDMILQDGRITQVQDRSVKLETPQGTIRKRRSSRNILQEIEEVLSLIWTWNTR